MGVSQSSPGNGTTALLLLDIDERGLQEKKCRIPDRREGA